MEPDTAATRFASGDHEFLRHVALEEHRLREIDRLGADASYAVGLIYSDLGHPRTAADLLEHAWRTAPEPFASEALAELVALLQREELEPRRQALAAELADSDDVALAGEQLRINYERQAYQAVLDDGAALLARARAELPAASLVRQEHELWYAVSLSRLNPDSGTWRDAMRAIFSEYPATSIHSRLSVFLLVNNELGAAFDESELRFFRAKQLLAEGRFVESSALFEELAAGPPDPGRRMLLGEYGRFDFFRAAAAARDLSAARSLELLASQLQEPEAARTLERAGRVFRASGAPTRAIAPLERALAISADSDRQRILWYLWSARIRSDTRRAAREIGTAVASFEDPAWYADLFTELGARLIEAGAWPELLAAYRSIRDFADPGTLARYELVLALLYERSLLPAAPARGEALRRDHLERAASQQSDTFSAIVASALLGDSGVSALALAEEPERAPAAPSGREEALAAAYLRYGLLERYERALRAGRAEIAPAAASGFSRRLAEQGEFPLGIVSTNWIEAAGGVLTPERAMLRYPRAFAGIIDTVARDEELDPWIFYALIREESLFNARVESSAGAQGLAQLMESTAEDIAGRMRLDSFALDDPADNLAIGGRYFALLNAQFGTPSRAIAAYNGGQGNVRRWERMWSTADDLLFHRRIPFAETFNHVRKVVVSAAYYGYLYAGRSPSETVRRIFALGEEDS